MRFGVTASRLNISKMTKAAVIILEFIPKKESANFAISLFQDAIFVKNKKICAGLALLVIISRQGVASGALKDVLTARLLTHVKYVQ